MGRGIQAAAPKGAGRLPMKTVSPTRSVTSTSCTVGASSASAMMTSASSSIGSIVDCTSNRGPWLRTSPMAVTRVLRSAGLKPKRATR